MSVQHSTQNSRAFQYDLTRFLLYSIAIWIPPYLYTNHLLLIIEQFIMINKCALFIFFKFLLLGMVQFAFVRANFGEKEQKGKEKKKTARKYMRAGKYFAE